MAHALKFVWVASSVAGAGRRSATGTSPVWLMLMGLLNARQAWWPGFFFPYLSGVRLGISFLAPGLVLPLVSSTGQSI